jgi:predicted transcriptional regulator
MCGKLAFNKMIQKGLKDSKEGKVISNKEMKKRIQSW